MKLQVLQVFIGVLIAPCIGYANTDMVHFRGFGSVSAVYSDSEFLAFRRDMTQEGKLRQLSLVQDSLLGLQSDIYFNDAFKASIQVVAKDRVNNSIDDSVTWANVSYDFNNAWNFRAGRIGSDLTLIGDVGNISYSYEWVRPPVDFYGAIPFYSFDGGELLYRHSFAKGHLNAKLFYGRSGGSFKYKSSESEFELVPFAGASIRYENGGFTYRAAYARTEIDSTQQSGYDSLRSALLANSYLPGVGETFKQLDSHHSPIDYYTMGFEYRYQSWKWLAEASYMDTDIQAVLPAMSAYTGLVKRIDNFAFYGLLAHARTTKSPASASSELPDIYRVAIQSVLDATDFEQSTASLGVRWDVAPNVALKGQWDRSWVAANKDYLWDGKPVTTDEQVNVFTLSMSFVF